MPGHDVVDLRSSGGESEGLLVAAIGKRMDEAQPGEDPQTAGEWIQVLELRPPVGSAFAAIDFAPVAPGDRPADGH